MTRSSHPDKPGTVKPQFSRCTRHVLMQMIETRTNVRASHSL